MRRLCPMREVAASSSVAVLRCKSPEPMSKTRWQRPHCLAEVAVQIGPVSRPNSLITGNLTGNFSNLGLLPRNAILIHEQIQSLAAKFPTQWNREFFWRNRESRASNREFGLRPFRPYRATRVKRHDLATYGVCNGCRLSRARDDGARTPEPHPVASQSPMRFAIAEARHVRTGQF
jgi:hypothetical protein